MDKGKFGSFIALALLVLSATLFSGNVLPAETSGVPEGSWGVNIENVGKIALTCRKYRSNDNCEMFWIFAALPVIAEIEDGKLKIHTDKTGKEALLISLKNGEPYKFLQSSIITAEYLPHYASAEIKNLRVAGIGGYADITDFRRHGSDYNKYHERGGLNELPASLPGWIMNPAAYIFKSERTGAQKGLNRILEHPGLTADTLRDMYQFIRDNRDSPKHYLSIIARNPSTSREVLNDLFYKTKESEYSYMSILNAAASNPNSPAEFKAEYINIIKTGGEKVQAKVLYDRQASPEILDWIARNGRISFKSSLYHHRNIWPETLDYLLEQPIRDEDIRSIAENPNISDKTLLKLAKREYRSLHWQGIILEIITRYQDRNEEAVQVAMARLANSHDVARRKVAARDERITGKLVNQFINSQAIDVRQALAGNKHLGSDNLLKLANDDYAVVAKEARQQLKSRFKNEYEQAASGFTPLSELNPALSLHHELDLAVKRNDIDEVKRVIDKHRTIRPPPYGVDMTPVFASNNRELAKLLFEVTNQHFKYLIKNREFNADWLRFMLSVNALEGGDDFKVLSECIKLKRTDYVDILLEHAYDINAIEKGSGQNLLYTVIQMRDEDLLEYLLDKGIDTNIRNKWRQSPAAYARRSNFIDAIEMLDDAGVYESEITRFRKQFTPDPDSRLVGKWSNLQGEFKTAVLDFHLDGSGKMLGAVAGSLIAWKDIDGSNLVIIPNIGGKLDESKQLELRYSIADDMLTIWHKDNKQMVYYRVHDQTVTEFKQAQQSRDPQYVGSWSSNDSDAVIQIRDDGTAISGKNSYVWKNGDGNYILLLATDGEKILNGKTVRLNKDDSKDVLTVKKGRRSIMLSRVI